MPVRSPTAVPVRSQGNADWRGLAGAVGASCARTPSVWNDERRPARPGARRAGIVAAGAVARSDECPAGGRREKEDCVTTVENVSTTPVVIGRPRGGPDRMTLRQDRWWVQPLVTGSILVAFVAYSTWAVLVNGDYYAGASLHRDLISPFYSPCIAASCVPGAGGTAVVATWWHITPAIIIIGGPLGFRMTCYYYRRAYYRAFWASPPNCAVADGHRRYTGESRFPLVLQNIHRYFFLIGIIFNVILTIDAVMAFRLPGAGGIGISIGSLVLTVNAVLLWLYSMSCHAARHMCGGHAKLFSKSPVRHRLWKILTPLNGRHMQFAWASLIFVALTDVYVRLVASGLIVDPKII